MIYVVSLINNDNENYQQLRHGAVNLDADCQRLRHERDQLRHQLSTIPVPTAPGSELPGQNAQVQEECARLRREVAELSANASTAVDQRRTAEAELATLRSRLTQQETETTH